MRHLSKNWTLKSLTIGLQLRGTSTRFWEEGLKGLPPLPCVGNVTIVYHFPTDKGADVNMYYFGGISITYSLAEICFRLSNR